MQEISTFMGRGDYGDALDRLNECEREFPDSAILTLNKSGILIDIGSYLNDADTVERGIFAGEACLEDKSFDEHKAMLLYNIANGFQFRIRKYVSDNNTYFGTEEDVRRCIGMLRESIELSGRANAVVNLGNLYDEIGRPLEAIVEYEDAIKKNPDFGMAYGNKALAVKVLSYLSEHQGVYLVHAYQLAKMALSHEQSVVGEGGHEALDSFRQMRDEIKSAFKKQSKESLLDKDLTHPPFDKSKMEHEEASYTQFCLDNDLYLNLHIFDHSSTGSIGDNISLSFIASIRNDVEDQWIKETLMRLNEIKESYITGRYILWLSQQKNDSLSNISQQSLFANNLDYTAHNIYTGLLKSAYKEGFSTLDKLANTINYYLGLGNDENDVSFRNIWFTNLKRGNGFNPSITSQNHMLFGLYSILYELGGVAAGVRNSLEHRYFKVSTMGGDVSGAPTFDEFTQQTVDVYYSLKCAIVYLLNFISSCEEAKRQELAENGGIVPVIPIITDQWLDLW